MQAMIYTRQQLEEYENQTLAPYAVHSKDSKGGFTRKKRQIFAPVFSGTANAFMHTTAFRRWNIRPRFLSTTKAIITAHA
jgi:hypothetical protein